MKGLARMLRSPRNAWILLILLTVLLRLPALVHPMTLDDEGGYAVVAHELLLGGTLYEDALDRRPPGIFWIYAGIFQVVGPYAWAPFHAVAVGWILATMLGLYAIGKQLFSREAGLAAALLYSISTTRSDWVNLALNGEVMLNLPVVWALYLAFRPSRSRLRPELAAAGGLLAVAFLIKQPAATAALPVGLYVLLPGYRAARGLRFQDSVLQAALLTASYFLVLGAAALVLHTQGVLDEAWHWTFTDHDVPHGPTDPVFWSRAAVEGTASLGAWLPLLLACGVSLRERARYWTDRGPERSALLLLLACATVGVSASGRFYSHYFFLLLPALVPLSAPALAAILSGEVRYRFVLLRRSVMVFLLVGTAGAFLVRNSIGIQEWRTPSPLSSYVREHSTPEDRIFIWGQRDWYYAEAQRRPASRFILSFPLTGRFFGSPLSDAPDYDTSYRTQPGAWETLERDFAEHPPLFFVDTDPQSEARKYPPQRYPYLRRLLAEEYEVVLTIPDGVVYRRLDAPPSRR
jgi:4-amino-4-deoxy-L-arabinose transferase-like glycosyltransferase